MVNEMLTQIESHPYPVAITTNLYDTIDPAAKRRFLFKIKCDYMTPQQADLAYGVFFDRSAPSEELRRLPSLTASDFSLVKKQIRFIPRALSDQKILSLLKIEALSRLERKSDYNSTFAGFTAELRPRNG
jgi:hypothetical protein